MSTETHKGFKCFYAKTALEWRNWLTKNHKSEDAVWLILFKKNSGISSFPYPEAIEEALCFGWIDSKANARDKVSYYQFFSKRNPKSNWSRFNKDKVEQLIEQNRMAPAGLEMIKLAKKTGTWDALNDVENLIVPMDLQEEFKKYPNALNHWEKFPQSVKRAILEWIFNAKRAETRQKRIIETAEKAEGNIRANQNTKP